MAPLSAWISLRPEWKLQDVQAALNVVITLISITGVSTVARYCWQSSARNVARNQTIPLSFLLSVNTPGEALDILLLLRSKILRWRHVNIFAQSVLVLCLSATSLLSGPIARYSTQRAHTIVSKEITGLLATRVHDSILDAPVLWNETFTSLDQAGFPYDQLLDYLPDTSIPWMYKSEEWNSSWAMNCKHTDSTPITLYDTGNCTSPYSEIPGLDDVISLDEYGPEIDAWWGGFYKGNINKDVLLALGGVKYTDYDNATNTTYAMTLSLASVHLHNLTRQRNSSSDCYFGRGNIMAASYTKIECDLQRLLHDPKIMHIAYPDSGTPALVARALVQYYVARFIQESISNTAITVLTPLELVRFYQTWVITKDTQYHEPVTRALSVQVPDVKISVVFLTIAILITVLILLGIFIYALSMLRHWNAMAKVPQSKLDWMLQSIQARNEECNPQNSSEKAILGHSVSSSSIYASSHTLSKTGIPRVDFEKAEYGGHFREQGPGAWQLSQRHGRAIYNNEDTAAPSARGTNSYIIPRKPVVSIYENRAPLLSVNLAESEDSISHTSKKSASSEQGSHQLEKQMTQSLPQTHNEVNT